MLFWNLQNDTRYWELFLQNMSCLEEDHLIEGDFETVRLKVEVDMIQTATRRP